MEVKSEKSSTSVDRQNVSFKFTKIVSKTLRVNKLNDEILSSRHETDYVISVDKSEIKSTAPVTKEKDLIVPLIKKNNWRMPDSHNDQKQDAESKLKELAIQELIKESKEIIEDGESESSKNNMSIPLMMQNKVPEGFETDDNMDVSLRPEESTLEDYERIPIEKFGLAMLKGMGWKDGDPIGANAKKAAQPIQVQLRPKGLGLGADTSALNKAKEKKKDSEKLLLVKGAYVQVIQGSNKGFYGEVLGLDEENARVIIKLSGRDQTATFPEFSIVVVSKKEYEKESKVINRATYEKYRQEQENSQSEYRSDEKSTKETYKSKERRESKKEKRSCRERSPDRKYKHKKSKHSDKSISSNHVQSSSNSSLRTWVRPQLKVRLIDDQFKKGSYFNEKLTVVDVLSSKNCTCKTENDRYLEGISTSMLETVIPRSENSYVMIVQGKYSGELCTILQKDKSKCVATVQFLSDRDQALQIEYDSICEYVGDVTDFD